MFLEQLQKYRTPSQWSVLSTELGVVKAFNRSLNLQFEGTMAEYQAIFNPSMPMKDDIRVDFKPDGTVNGFVIAGSLYTLSGAGTPYDFTNADFAFDTGVSVSADFTF